MSVHTADLFRVVTLFCASAAIFMASWTVVRGWMAEKRVSMGHPRRKLYRHIISIGFFHVWLMLGFAILLAQNFGEPLGWHTPVAFVGYVGTVYALFEMISYQNSRLKMQHRAKMMLGIVQIADAKPEERSFSVLPVGALEAISMVEWIEEFAEGEELCKIYIEKVEEPHRR